MLKNVAKTITDDLIMIIESSIAVVVIYKAFFLFHLVPFSYDLVPH